MTGRAHAQQRLQAASVLPPLPPPTRAQVRSELLSLERHLRLLLRERRHLKKQLKPRRPAKK